MFALKKKKWNSERDSEDLKKSHETEFATSFLVSVAYVMHYRKLDEVHELFCKMITDILPELIIEKLTDRFF